MYPSKAITSDVWVDGFTHAAFGNDRSSDSLAFADLGQVARRRCVPSNLTKPSVLRPDECSTRFRKADCSPLGSAPCETYQRKVVSRAS
jgi:hypothetical protein